MTINYPGAEVSKGTVDKVMVMEETWRVVSKLNKAEVDEH